MSAISNTSTSQPSSPQLSPVSPSRKLTAAALSALEESHSPKHHSDQSAPFKASNEAPKSPRSFARFPTQQPKKG